MTAPHPRWIASSPPRIPIARPCRRSRTSARAWIRSSSLRRIERKLQHIYSLAHRGPVRAARHPSRTTGSKSDVDPCRRPSRRPGHRNNDKTMPLSGNTYLWLDRAARVPRDPRASPHRGERTERIAAGGAAALGKVGVVARRGPVVVLEEPHRPFGEQVVGGREHRPRLEPVPPRGKELLGEAGVHEQELPELVDEERL